MQKVQAKKSLGQHFLTDLNIAQKIVEALRIENPGTVLEIGPGMGVLTEFLVREKIDYKAVELDVESVNYLVKKYPDFSDSFLEADILKFDLDVLKSPISIIGNLPYYISSQIFFKILKNKDLVNEAVCMIQKEVAERIASGPGSKKFGILSVFLQAFYNIDYLFTVHEHCFSPAPNVKSAVIRLSRNNIDKLDCDEELFFKVVKAGFNQRRKTLRNSLKSFFITLEVNHELLTKRPEQLSIDQFVELTNIVDSAINGK